MDFVSNMQIFSMEIKIVSLKAPFNYQISSSLSKGKEKIKIVATSTLQVKSVQIWVYQIILIGLDNDVTSFWLRSQILLTGLK